VTHTKRLAIFESTAMTPERFLETGYIRKSENDYISSEVHGDGAAHRQGL
jgi:hypothetical protein